MCLLKPWTEPGGGRLSAFSHISVCLNSTEYEFAFASVLTLNLESWLKEKLSNAAANRDDRRRLESEEMSMDVNDDGEKKYYPFVYSLVRLGRSEAEKRSGPLLWVSLRAVTVYMSLVDLHRNSNVIFDSDVPDHQPSF